MKPLSRLALLSAFLLVAAPQSRAATSILLGLEGMLNSTGSLLPTGSFFEVGTFSGDTATFDGTWSVLGVSSLDVPGATNPLPGITSDGDTKSVAFGSDYVGPFAVRVYDSPDNSGTFNTVYSGAFDTTPPLGSGFSATSSNAGSLTWQDSGNAFRTSIPEPSTGLLGLLGLTLLLRRRR